ncbi:MAG: glycosyltransferase [Flavobacteriales bacterium]|nr:glycosyltransferase [Flavobacteriales bacterium]
MKLVSVIIPLYNTERYIKETVVSVLNQTYKNLELIIIDDGSTDNSYQIVSELSNGDDRVHIIQQQNMGVSVARNKGIEIAKGDYIFFLDSDDVWLPKNIELKVEIFKNFNTVDWLFGSIGMIDKNSNTLNSIIKGSDRNILNSLLEWNGDVITTPSSICVKKECLSNITFDQNLSTAADQDFAIQLAATYIGKYMNEPIVLYRVLPDSMSRNIELMEKDHIYVFKKAAKNNLFTNFWFKQKCFSNLYWILAGSWWKNENNKSRGLYFIFLALLINPISIFRFINSKP